MERNTSKIVRSVNSSKYNFTPISNHLIQNVSITLEARGLICFILSLPENWVIYKGQVQKALKMGDIKFDRIWKECNTAGYISVKKQRLPNGRFVYHYSVTDSISTIENTTGGKPTFGEPTSIEKKEEEKIYKENKDQEINTRSLGSDQISFSDIFNQNISKEDVLNYINNQ
jgi:hypothetical protein